MASDAVFAGSIPEIYDRLLVPLIFQPYAEDVAARVAAAEPTQVLELAAGTGVVTRVLAARLPASTRIIATDLNQPMLDHAAAKQPQKDRIVWRQADALAVPFADQEFDTVVCQFGVMFFPDKIKAYGEARRVLKPGRPLFFNVWDDIARNEFSFAVTEALAGVFPNDPPQFMARTPHGYHDTTILRADLTAAGFTKISFDAVERKSRAPSARDVAVAFCQGTPLRGEIETRDAARLEEATATVADFLAHRFGNGPIEGRIQACVVTAQ